MLRPLSRLLDIVTGGKPDSPQNRWKTLSRWRRDREEIGWQLMLIIVAVMLVIATMIASQVWLRSLQATTLLNQ